VSVADFLPASLAAQLVGQEVCVTFVTIGELARWAERVVTGQDRTSVVRSQRSHTTKITYKITQDRARSPDCRQFVIRGLVWEEARPA